MTRGYALRLILWAALVVGFFSFGIHWSARTVPAAISEMMEADKPAPPAEHSPVFRGLTAYVSKPLAWIRDNILFLIEIGFLILAARGAVGGILGVPDLVHDIRAGIRYFNGVIIGLTIGNCFFVAYVTDQTTVPWMVNASPTLLPVNARIGHPGEAEAIRKGGHFLLWSTAPALILCCAARPRGIPWIGLGMASSLLVAFLVVNTSWELLAGMDSGDWRRWYAYTPGAADGRIPVADFPMHMIATGFAILPLSLILALSAAAALGRPGSPVWVVCLCLWLFNASYGFVAFHFGGLQFVLLAFGSAIVVAANARHPYKLGLPGMIPEYEAARKGHPVPLLAAESPAGASPIPLLTAAEMLTGFRERWQAAHGPATKPKLLVLCASGGGIRAGVWTAAVIAELEAKLGPAFGRHLRLITGASGGMLEAALYAGRSVHPMRPPWTDAEVLARDSLWPTWQGLFFQDAPAAVLPFYRSWDRAQSLEASWIRNSPGFAGPSPLTATFRELLPAERAGEAPSLIFSPLMVEDGRQLLISNLCLRDLTTETAATAGETADGSPSVDRLRISRPAVEFFRLFPRAHSEFRLSTAARLSATFPYVSPAVHLPTSPPRRLVDAGFYDNYGVGLAAGWLLRNRELIRQNCGGVAVIEVRAFPLENKKTGATDEGIAEGGITQSGHPLSTVFAGISTPAEALGVVRAAGAYFRNDHLLGLLDSMFNPPSEAPFFVRVPVECTGDGSMSWAISRKVYGEVLGNIRAVQGSLAGLAAWFGDGGR